MPNDFASGIVAGAPVAGRDLAGAAVSMEKAVGYARIACDNETLVEDAMVLKHDRLFLLTNHHGDIDPPGSCGLGLFHDDTRILSHYALQVAGGPPTMLSAQVLRPYATQIDLAVSDLGFGGSRWDPKHAVHIRRELLLDDVLMERLTLTNYLITPIEYWIELLVGCDFADIFEVRGWNRQRRGEFYAPQVERDRITFTYRGTDGQLIRSGVHFRDVPDELDGRCARWRFQLDPNTSLERLWEVQLEPEVPERSSGTRVYPVAPMDMRRSRLSELYDRWNAQCSRWTSDVEVFDATLLRAIDDLRALYVEADNEQVISAGIPWYSTVF